jgi:TolB protein
VRVILAVSTALSLFLLTDGVRGQAADTSVGIFEGHGDVGTVLHAGSAKYDEPRRVYTITGSGNNMWATEDDFQFVWKKMSGDVSLASDIAILGQGGNLHKKAVLMVRQSLDADSVYVDVALHVNGLTALQFRDEKGTVTHDIEMNLSAPAPKRLQLVKQGDSFSMWVAGAGEELHPSGAAIRVAITPPFYVGVGMCAHDKDAVETGVFSNVELAEPTSHSVAPTTLYSTLETVAVDSGNRHVIYSAKGRFEAPNWTHDGSTFLFNRDGRIVRLPVSGGTPELIDTGFATRCNNDHGVSPDSTQLAISDQSQEEHQSLVYIVAANGGTPRRITQKSPSYWHGWSPDGKTLAFVGQREGEFDIYTIPAAGGEERRLTTAPGLDDGPEYSPDGKYIYFNSERTGLMQIWRMHPDGAEQERVIADEWSDWFPHISPDGKWMAFLSYEKDVKGHPENKNVTLRLMSMSDKKISVLARLFGGQGTINVPSWSPDSKQVAFVSYQLAAKDASGDRGKQ